MSGLSVGSTIAGCRLEAVAGRGGMGVVYRATQVGLGRPVAVKAVAPELAGDPEFRERFTRESHLAASLDHPNVIPVYEAGEADGTLYLIMRWVDGTDLGALIAAEGRISPARAVALLRPVASALAAAHRRGLVHRDIKPANVLIARAVGGEPEHVYLTDFGIARRTDGEAGMTRTGMFLGTVDYAPPERIEGDRGTGASDIYSFGCVLFEALTGHVPFDRPSAVARMFAHVNDPIPSASAEVPGIPERFDEIVARAMAKRPDDRFATAADLVLALDRGLAELEARERTARTPRPGEAIRIAAGDPAAAPARAGEPTAPTMARDPAPARDAASRGVRRRPGRRALIGAGAGLVVLAAVVAVLAAESGGGNSRTKSTPAASGSTPAGRTESTAASASPSGGTATAPASNAPEIVAMHGAGLGRVTTAALGGAPAAASVDAAGAAWVSLPEAGETARVAAISGAKQVLPVGGQPSALAAGGAGVWVAGSAAGPLALFRGSHVLAKAPLPAAPIALAVDPSDGSAWTIDGAGTVSHVGRDGAVEGTVAVAPAPAPTALGVGEGWVWAVNGTASGLIRIDPRTYGPTIAFRAGPDPVSVAFDRGVWVANANGQVTRFDPRSTKLDVNATLATGAPRLDEIGAAEGRPVVWAISRQARTLYRISNAHVPAVTGTVVLASAPTALAVSGSDAWVATADGTLIEFSGG